MQEEAEQCSIKQKTAQETMAKGVVNRKEEKTESRKRRPLVSNTPLFSAKLVRKRRGSVVGPNTQRNTTVTSFHSFRDALEDGVPPWAEDVLQMSKGEGKTNN